MFLYGTSSWHEKSWVGPFYPEGMRSPDWLSHYATQFSTVEVDSTYYGTPKPATVDNWRARTPDGFVMCVKFPRGIVHGGDTARPDADVALVLDKVGKKRDAFLDVIGRLGDRCGPLVMQFPYFSGDARSCGAGLGPGALSPQVVAHRVCVLLERGVAGQQHLVR